MPPETDTNDDVDTTSATDQADDTTEATESDETDTTDGVDQLGDAGKKALDRMKAERNAERQAKKQLEAELAELRKESESDIEKRIREATEAATAGADRRVVSAEVRAAAAGKLADPADAIKFLDLTEFEVDSDGNVDTDAIATAIGGLVESKPYLAAQRGGFQGSGDQGARKDAAGPPQLNRDDLSRMSPEQIEDAREKGQLDQLMQNPSG